MKQKGIRGYIPRIVVEELDNIRIEEGIERRADAFKLMGKYSKIGRNTIAKIDNSLPLGRKYRK